MPQPQEPPEPDSRRTVAMGFLIIALLVAGGLLLVYKLRAISQLEDCAMQGRSNCIR
jgi:hypothetical protein